MVAEVSERTQQREEEAASSARVIRRIVEVWTNAELKEMRVDRAVAEEKGAYAQV